MRKENTKQATHLSDFHAHGNKSTFWPIRLAGRRHQQLPKLEPLMFLGSSPHCRCANTAGSLTLQGQSRPV